LTGAIPWPYLAATVLGVAALFETAVREWGHSRPSYASLIALAVVAPVALTRTWPVAAAWLSAICAVLGLATNNLPPVAALAALMIIFYTAGLHRPARFVILALIPLIGYAIAPQSAALQGGRLFSVALLAVVAVAAGGGIARRARGEALRRDASDRAFAYSLSEHAARGERARIARELHDVVAHHISMIAVQAEAARLTTPGLPPEGAKRLTAIGDTARTALTEMRRLLGVLREDVDDVEPTRRPQPGLHQLNELLDEVRDLGSGNVRLIVHGRVVPVDPGIELTAYRIVQEALTNARRHAAGAAVDVELDFRETALMLRVRDNGPGPGASAGGHGLSGMRERVAMAGGSLVAGAAPVGGFVVEAVLPLDITRTETRSGGGAAS
jgi:signal transduction histidine kinase